MTIKLTTTLDGFDALRDIFKALPKEARAVTRAVIEKSAEVVEREARKQSPWDISVPGRRPGYSGGDLYRSIEATPISLYGRSFMIKVQATVPYAIYVHENLTARHPIGKARFLADPLMAEEMRMPGKLQRAIDRLIKRRFG